LGKKAPPVGAVGETTANGRSWPYFFGQAEETQETRKDAKGNYGFVCHLG